MPKLTDRLVGVLRFLNDGPAQLAATRAQLPDLQAELADLRDRLNATAQRFDIAAQRLEASVQRLEQGAGELREQLLGQEQASVARFEQTQHQISALDQALGAVRADGLREADWARNQVGGMAAALDRLQGAGRSTPAPPSLQPASVAAAEESFYLLLEQQFRGSPEDVRNRLNGYRDWVSTLTPGPVADLGCGRGEWLELLGEWGRAATGVDLNALNAQALRARGLDAHQGDLLQWLQAQPESSFAALTLFHVVEHLPFGVLLRLAQEARRVLVPGGRLILETPNPENLIVATQTFWLDPSHVRPLPPALLELVVRDAGLQVEALLRLSPPPGNALDVGDATLRAMMMQGRDYAVIACKPGIPS